MSKLVGLPIASLVEEAKVGIINDVVIHPDTGELIGFWVKVPNGLLGGRKALSARDIISYESNAITINNNQAIVDPEEVRPFKAIVDRGGSWIGKVVKDEDGKNLGRVKEVVIETDLDTVAKIHVGSLWGAERVIDRNQIVKIKKDAIIVRSDLVLVADPATMTGEMA